MRWQLSKTLVAVVTIGEWLLMSMLLLKKVDGFLVDPPMFLATSMPRRRSPYIRDLFVSQHRCEWPIGCRKRMSSAMKADQNAAGSETETGTKLNKGFGLLELAGGLIPQGGLVKTARTGWKFIWLQMMRELAPQSQDGAYVRPSYGFRGWIGRSRFPADVGRYHIYVGNTCPWCHRAVLAVVLRNLSTTVTFSYMDDNPDKASRGGWTFTSEQPDPVFGCNDLREVYELCSPGFKGRCTAPVMVDKKARKIVNNESRWMDLWIISTFGVSYSELNSQIVRMLNEVGPGDSKIKGEAADSSVDLCPPSMEEGIDKMNDFVYNKINNGVYRAGFATSQAAYEEACRDVFKGLSHCDEILSKNRFLLGERFTEADLRLIPTALRFDAVYATLFKCATRRWSDFPSLHAWLRDVYQLPGVASTIDIDAARKSYFTQLFPLNPGGIAPIGPSTQDMGLDVPAERGSQKPSDVFWIKE